MPGIKKMKPGYLPLILILLLPISSHEVFSSEHTSKPLLKLLQDQFEAYNQRDIDRLVNNVTDDFKWYSLTADKLLIETSGKENFKKSMLDYYNSRPQNIHSVIESYTIDGNRISFKEVVSHKAKDGRTKSSSAMGIYEFKNGKIYRAWYFVD